MIEWTTELTTLSKAEEIRVRFAPSPTGEPHVGNLRTALFNWLFARHHGGTFLLRVEDTDQSRYVEDALGVILESLRWLGLDWDEGPEVDGPYAPYLQSQRLDIYHEVTRDLVDRGCAYWCHCSRDRLDRVRKERQRDGLPGGYDRHCRDLGLSRHIAPEAAQVVRFKMPLEGETAVDDLIRGRVRWDNSLSDDFIILKSDGFPTYHLANVVDDHIMRISHVLRAEEWLSSTPRHLQLYDALGYEPPLFGHLPMILGPDRAKLSKRHGSTSMLEYRSRGFLPEAMVNFMALLGWSLDDKTDVISRSDLVESFSLERVGKGAAVFDLDRLQWMNGVYIRALDDGDLAERMLPYLGSDGDVDRKYLRRIVPLVRERLKTMADVPEWTSYFFDGELSYDAADLVQKGMDRESTVGALGATLRVLEGIRDFAAEPLEEVLRATGADLELSGRKLFGAIRVAVTGRSASPPIFETMEVLGRERCLDRIGAAMVRLDAQKAGSPGRAP